MKVMQIVSLEGLSESVRDKGLAGISTTEAWVCPMGRDPRKLSKRQLGEVCRQVTIAEVAGARRAKRPRGAKRAAKKARRRR